MTPDLPNRSASAAKFERTNLHHIKPGEKSPGERGKHGGPALRRGKIKIQHKLICDVMRVKNFSLDSSDSDQHAL